MFGVEDWSEQSDCSTDIGAAVEAAKAPRRLAIRDPATSAQVG